jgi:hypothetical protein
MRVLPVIAVLTLSGLGTAQLTAFKIYPGVAPAFDQTCTSFTSRCNLGAAGGEYLQEIPAGGRDSVGNTNDFYRGIGGGDGPVQTCNIGSIFYITQDQNCVDQEAYEVHTRSLAGGGSGPTTGAGGITFNSGPLLTPTNGSPSPCAWGITLTLGTPSSVPCAQSWFVGTTLAANSAWTANGQSHQGSWYVANTIGDVPRVGAGKIAWEIKADGVTVAQCGTDRINDIGVGVECPTLTLGNIHADPRCPVDPAHGAGGLWPSNTARGDGISHRIRDAQAVDGTPVYTFLGFSLSPVGLCILPGILSKCLWINPAGGFIQTSFGTVTTTGGVADVSPAFMGRTRLVGIGGAIHTIGLVGGVPPFPWTNTACSLLSATN